MKATLLYKWKLKSLKFLYSFFYFSDDPGMSFPFFMHVGFADILRQTDINKHETEGY